MWPKLLANHAMLVSLAVTNAIVAPRFTAFKKLTSPQEHKTIFEQTASTDVTVVKWMADGCRTCKAATPKITSIMKRWDQPGAQFYSMQLQNGDKAMLTYFQEKNVSQLPFVELYVGNELVDSLVVPPSRVSFLKAALSTASGRWRITRASRERRRLLLSLRSHRREQKALNWRRIRLSQRWRRYRLMLRLVHGADSKPSRTQRRKHLRSLRALRQERKAHMMSTTRLERRWSLFKLIVMGRSSTRLRGATSAVDSYNAVEYSTV